MKLKELKSLKVRTSEKVQLNDVAESFKIKEVFFTESQADSSHSLSDSMSLLLLDMQPNIVFAYDSDGKLMCVSGGEFLFPLVMFIQGYINYPKDGMIEDFRGKLFDDLTVIEQDLITYSYFITHKFSSEDIPWDGVAADEDSLTDFLFKFIRD